MRLFGWFRKEKEIQYATARLVDNVVDAEQKGSKPLLDKKDTYIKHIGRLKQAIISESKQQARFYKQYLSKNGLGSPETEEECDALILRIRDW